MSRPALSAKTAQALCQLVTERIAKDLAEIEAKYEAKSYDQFRFGAEYLRGDRLAERECVLKLMLIELIGAIGGAATEDAIYATLLSPRGAGPIRFGDDLLRQAERALARAA